jgi:hypothetical protein
MTPAICKKYLLLTSIILSLSLASILFGISYGVYYIFGTTTPVPAVQQQHITHIPQKTEITAKQQQLNSIQANAQSAIEEQAHTISKQRNLNRVTDKAFIPPFRHNKLQRQLTDLKQQLNNIPQP